MTKLVSIVHSEDAIKFSLLDSDTHLLSESVIIPMRNYSNEKWFTLCISSQMGCARGCSFCATGSIGLKGNLSVNGILNQYYEAEKILIENKKNDDTRNYVVKNIVFMGMGEPFDNWDNVGNAIRFLERKHNFPLSRISVSTSGHLEGLKKIMNDEWKHIRLAISINSADDKIRSKIMPINRIWPLSELKKVLINMPLGKRNKFMFEYAMIKDVNDSDASASQLADWCKKLPCIVNLIKFNSFANCGFVPSDDQVIMDFQNVLMQKGVFTKIRQSAGSKIQAACGQLIPG